MVKSDYDTCELLRTSVQGVTDEEKMKKQRTAGRVTRWDNVAGHGEDRVQEAG
jgi:hypothetical protein